MALHRIDTHHHLYPAVYIEKTGDVLKQESRPQAAQVETTTELWAFFRGEFVPLRDANINVMTHGFNYGTAVFEGVAAHANTAGRRSNGRTS